MGMYGRQAIQYTGSQTYTGFVWAKINGVYVYSCYDPPSLTLPEFEEMLDSLVLNARGRSPRVIVGDFNAWVREWGSRETNSRDRSLLDAFVQLDIILANEKYVDTFQKEGSASIVDLASVSQGSVLVPLLWNIMCDDVFNLPLPEEVTVVGCAEDIALVVVAKHLEDAELYSCEAISAVKGWLESSGPILAEKKTEAVFITKRRKRNFARIQIGNHIIHSNPANTWG